MEIGFKVISQELLMKTDEGSIIREIRIVINIRDQTACLDGVFTKEELKRIIKYMENK